MLFGPCCHYEQRPLGNVLLVGNDENINSYVFETRYYFSLPKEELFAVSDADLDNIVSLLTTINKNKKNQLRRNMGSLTKQLYRYTHKRDMRHNENLWPFIKISRNETGEISDLRYKGHSINLTTLSSLRHQFDDEILIAATGPSVKTIDFSSLPTTVVTAGVNGAWHLNNALNFSLYFVVDMTFIDRQTALLKRLIDSKKVILLLPSWVL